MILSYLTDLIDIILPAVDEWGVVTKTTQSNIKARVEYSQKMVLNNSGQEVMGLADIFIDPSATITHESKIKVRKINGVDTQIMDKELIIKRGPEKHHGFSGFEYWEVTV